MASTSSIALIDNTVPRQLVDDGDLSPSTSRAPRALSKRLTKSSVRDELTRIKYRKWQPQKLGIAGPIQRVQTVDSRQPSARESLPTDDSDGASGQQLLQVTTTAESAGNVPSRERDNGSTVATADGAAEAEPTSHSELDILYENQRGWFFCGIPLYSHQSLLNFDPSAWATADMRDSPVNITNAQVPDPSWEWGWKTWYVDMSGDVDDQGWQYSFSFSSKAWHGTHPWFHSFVRRRRWVRLRIKRRTEKHSRGRSEFEMAHRLNEDYFTIHSSTAKTRESSSDPMLRSASASQRGFGHAIAEEGPPEEIRDIRTLMQVLRTAVVDREKVEALKRFMDEGGAELHYLEENIPEIMSLFFFQASRWQLLTHMLRMIRDLSQEQAKADDGVDGTDQKREDLVKASEAVKRHISGPEVVGEPGEESVHRLLDLTPVSRHRSILSRHPGPQLGSDEAMPRLGRIKGIPKAAEIEHEGHIY